MSKQGVIDSLLQIVKPLENNMLLTEAGSPQYNALAEEREVLLTSVQFLLEEREADFQSKKTTFIADASVLKGLNATIETNDEVHLITQLTQDLYLSFASKPNPSFSEDEVSLLELISGLCPLLSGPSVYNARAMYAVVNPTAAFVDQEICNAAGIEMMVAKKDSILQPITVAPNPTTGDVMIAKHGGKGQLQFFDMLGSAVLSPIQLIDELPVYVDMLSLPKGVYVVHVEHQGATLSVQQIVKY